MRILRPFTKITDNYLITPLDIVLLHIRRPKIRTVETTHAIFEAIECKRDDVFNHLFRRIHQFPTLSSDPIMDFQYIQKWLASFDVTLYFRSAVECVNIRLMLRLRPLIPVEDLQLYLKYAAMSRSSRCLLLIVKWASPHSILLTQVESAFMWATDNRDLRMIKLIRKHFGRTYGYLGCKIVHRALRHFTGKNRIHAMNKLVDASHIIEYVLRTHGMQVIDSCCDQIIGTDYAPLLELIDRHMLREQFSLALIHAAVRAQNVTMLRKCIELADNKQSAIIRARAYAVDLLSGRNIILNALDDITNRLAH